MKWQVQNRPSLTKTNDYLSRFITPFYLKNICYAASAAILYKLCPLLPLWETFRTQWFRTLWNRDVSTGPLAPPLARSLAPLTHSLAPHCSVAHSLAPELMGKKFLSIKATRRFHTFSTHSARKLYHCSRATFSICNAQISIIQLRTHTKVFLPLWLMTS